MFDFVRTHNRILQVALGLLIIPSFAIFGIQGYTHLMGDGSVEVASVDGKAITQAEWDGYRRRVLDQQRERNPNLDPKQFDTPEAKRAALDAIVRERVLQTAVVRQNLEASDDRVQLELKKGPDFASLRAMDPAQRTAALAARGMTPDSFFDNVRGALTQQQALHGVEASSLVPAVTSKANLDAFFDKREIQWQAFEPKDFAGAIQPTDAEVQAYFADKSHASEFLAPEQAKIDYVVLDLAALKAQLQPTDDDLKKYYDEHAKLFSTQEERHVSHILVNVDPKATPAEREKAKARAEELLAEVRKNPASFAAVAKRSSDDAGTKDNGGDLDWIARDTFKGASAAIGDAAFSLKQGEVSDVVQSDVGYHILTVTGIRGGSTKSLDEVRGQVVDAVKSELAQKKWASAAEQFSNTVYEQPNSLDPVLKAMNLQKQTAVVNRKPASDAAGPLASQRLLDAVFSPAALNNKQNTEAVETARTQLVSAHVVSYTPAHQRTLAEVHDQVVGALRAQQAAAAAQKEGAARLAAVQKDPGIALPQSGTVGRTVRDSTAPQKVTEAALKVDLSKGPVVTGVALPDGAYVVLRVVKDVPRPADDAESTQSQQFFAQAFDEAESQAVYEALKVRYKTKVDEARVSQVTDSSASAPK
jgi:peptidyl-prolyl cis-trans isomerase D